MKEYAMLIMAHYQFDILEKLFVMLDHERNDIYIHIDKKRGNIDEEQSQEDYCYFHLLSGVDLQIKHTEEIHKFFDEHPRNQFIALRNVYSGLGGLNRYYFPFGFGVTQKH